MNLQNKVALVTGSNRGIGEAIAKALAKEGAKLMLTARDTKELERVRDEIREFGGNASYFSGDITNPADVEAVVANTLSVHEGLDILINNAGIFIPRSLTTTTPEKMKRQIDVNLLGPMYFTQSAVGVARQSGRPLTIIDIISTAGLTLYPGNHTGYALSKLGHRAFSYGIELEQRDYGIGVWRIYPGNVKTGILQDGDKEILDIISGAPKLEPIHVANLVVNVLRGDYQKRDIKITPDEQERPVIEELDPTIIMDIFEG